MQLKDVADAVSRILQAKWAEAGKRGERYTVTALGKQELEVPF